MKKILASLFIASLFIACGNKNEPGKATDSIGTADSTQALLSDSIDTQVADQPDKSFGNPKKDPFTAILHADGSVSIKANKEPLEKFIESNEISNKFKRNQAKIKGLGERCIDISIIQFEDDWLVCMLTDKGHIAMLSLKKVITQGDLTCSGPIPTIKGIKKISVVSLEEGYAFKAQGAKENSIIINTSGYQTKFEYEGFKMTLASDYSIRMEYPTKKWQAQGAFFETKFDSGDAWGYHELTAKINGYNYTISITKRYDDDDDNDCEVSINTKDPSFKFDDLRDATQMIEAQLY